MTEDQLVDAIFDREGDRYADQFTHPPIDQPTAAGGITLGTLRRYIAAHPTCGLAGTVEQLRTLTHTQCSDIIRWLLRDLAHQHGFDAIDFEPLRLQLVDFAYNSGPALAIRWLQRVLGVAPTGIMDPVTVAAVRYPYDPKRIPIWIHQSLIAARIEMIERATASGTVSPGFEKGLTHRAQTFSLLELS